MGWLEYAADLGRIGPELIVAATGLVLLLVDLWRMGRDSWLVGVMALLTTLGAAAGLLWAGASVAVDGAPAADLRPELAALIAVYALCTVADVWFRGRDQWLPGAVVLIGAALALFRIWGQYRAFAPFKGTGEVPEAATAFGLLVEVDTFSVFFRILTLLSLAVVACFTIYYRPMRRGAVEFLFCMTGAHLGILFLVSTTHLLMVFLSLELLSISSYILAGMRKGDRRSAEASLKYVIYGALASGLMLFGFSLLYGLTEDMTLAGVGTSLATVAERGPDAVLLALALLASAGGFAYKIAAVPFHFWAPDVYEGAPTPVTAFLTVTSKAGSLAILLRFLHALGEADPAWPRKLAMLFAISAAVTMTYGNLAALRQNNLKRLLGWSAIAHVGYLLMGVVALYAFTHDPATGAVEVAHRARAYESVCFYLVAYFLMNLGAFGVVIYLANSTGSEEMDDLRGLGWKAPWVSGAMVVFLLSLTGIPPMAGFVGKYYLMLAAVEGGFLWLAVVAAANTVVSLFYYFRVARALFLRPEEEAAFEVRPLPILAGVILALAAGTVWLGVYPSSILEAVRFCVASLG